MAADVDEIARVFEDNRIRLRMVAARILGSAGDAEDAVQEAWLRLSRSDAGEVDNLPGWLTTVVARVSLNMLQARRARREELTEDPGTAVADASPEDAAVRGDEVGIALQVVLDTLEPSQRLAFVLHDLFAVPFDEIAAVVGTSPGAARQLASRARRRVAEASGAYRAEYTAAQAGRREVVAVFLSAAREARFDELLELLDPSVVLRADKTAVRMGASSSVRGADAVARWLSGRARAAVAALVDGEPGAVWAVGGKVRVAFSFTISGAGAGERAPEQGGPEAARITGIDLIADPEVLGTLEIDAPGAADLSRSARNGTG